MNTGSARKREHSSGRASTVMPIRSKASGAAPGISDNWIARTTVFPSHPFQDPNMIRVPADPKGSTLRDNIPIEPERRSRGARESSRDTLINPKAYIYRTTCKNCGMQGDHNTEDCPAVEFAQHRKRRDISPDQDATSREVVHRRHAKTTESGDVRTRDSERNFPQRPPRGIPEPPAEAPPRDDVAEAVKRIRPLINETQRKTQAEALYRLDTVMSKRDPKEYDRPAPKHARKEVKGMAFPTLDERYARKDERP
jgi:hypothetical protein